MFDEQQQPNRLERPPHLGQSNTRVRDRAQGPGHHDRIEHAIGERKPLRRGLDQRYGDTRIRRSRSREPEQFSRWIDAADPIDRRPVQRQVQPRTDADLKHKTARGSNGLLPITREALVAHRQLDQTRQDQRLVEPHSLS